MRVNTPYRLQTYIKILIFTSLPPSFFTIEPKATNKSTAHSKFATSFNSVCKKVHTFATSAKTTEKQARQGKTNAANNTVKPSDYHFEHYANKNSCYAKLLFPKEDEWKNFADKFNHDVYVERGKNEQGGDKVYIIPFGKRH